MSNDELASAIETGFTQLADLLHEAIRRMDNTGRLELDGSSLSRTDLEEEALGLYTIADGSAEEFEQEEAVRFVERMVAAEPAPAAQPEWKTTKYMFWQAYQRAFKLYSHTQKMLSAVCKEHGIDQTDTSPATLARVRDILASQQG